MIHKLEILLAAILGILVGYLAAIHFLFAIAPTCHFEDDHNCKWDAKTQGNGEGDSFLDLTSTFGTIVFYV